MRKAWFVVLFDREFGSGVKECVVVKFVNVFLSKKEFLGQASWTRRIVVWYSREVCRIVTILHSLLFAIFSLRSDSGGALVVVAALCLHVLDRISEREIKSV